MRKLLAHALLILCLTSATAWGAELSSQQLKALYLFNFAKFTKWPKSKPKPSAPGIIIGIVGKIDFSEMIPLIDGKKVGQKSVTVKVFNTLDESLDQCHILFIGELEEGLSDVVEKLTGKAVLSVSEMKNFARRGGMVEMYLQENILGKQRLVFDINLSSLRKERLTMNSRVLKLANKRIR